MSRDPGRLQYLEAMGLTTWVARYRLPNAMPTPACEWDVPTPTTGEEAPGQRLHALLDAPTSREPEPRMPERSQRPAGPRKARALLGEQVPSPVEEVQPTSASRAGERPAESLRFTLQVACLAGRWLFLLPREASVEQYHRELLANLLQAAGVPAGDFPDFESLRWPPVEGVPVDAPLEEARQGLQAFIEGRRRRGWSPRRLLVFGHDDVLTSLLTLEGERSTLLDLPAWQGPGLDELAGSADAKRALWPRIQAWQRDWESSEEEGRAAPPDGR